MAKAVKKARKQDVSEDVSYLDLNQIELAYINRVIEEGTRVSIPRFVDISRTRRILAIQKTNLEDVCRTSGKEYRKAPLESELKGILRGRKALSMACFMFK